MCNNKTKRAILTVGISCSGKTTWTNEFVHKATQRGESWAVVCRDDIREQMHIERKNQPFQWATWNWKWEKFVTLKQTEMIQRYAVDPTIDGVIISDTNLSLSTKQRLNQLLQSNNFTVDEKVFSISFFEACQ